jgi:hypothetical protein
MGSVPCWVAKETQPKRFFAEQAFFSVFFHASLFSRLSGLLGVSNAIREVGRQVFWHFGCAPPPPVLETRRLAVFNQGGRASRVVTRGG